jgi:hypothetical protein
VVIALTITNCDPSAGNDMPATRSMPKFIVDMG